MKKLIQFLTICAVVIITAGSVWADTHYVDPAGSNEPPYTTPATAAWSIQDAINAAINGDVVDVADATYTITGKITVDKGVTITGNTVSPANVVVQYSPAANSLMFDMRASNATIQGIKVTNGKTGFWFDQSGVTGCTISNCIVGPVNEYGIYMKNGGSGHTINLCTISNTGQTYAGAPAVLIENCLDVTFSNNTLSSISDKGVYVRVCNAGSVADRVEVTGNNLSGCAYSCIQVYQSPYTYIYNNTISSTSDKGLNIIGPNASSQAARVVVEGNSISGCPWGGILLTHDRYTYIYNNTIFSTGDKGISIANGENVANSAERIIVEENNVSGTKYPGIQVAYAVPFTYIYNNTLSGCNYYGADGTGDWDYASIHVAENCENTVVDNNDISDGINGIQIWSDDCTVTNNTIYDMGLTYADTKVTGDGTYYNSGIIVGTNWLTLNFKPTGTTITGNNIHDNYWGLYVRDYATLSPSDPSVLSVTAEKNWWGDASGPSGVGPGTGDAVSANVDYSPWWGANYVGDPHTTAWTWYTNDNIQDAIDAATTGDVINVATGTYGEAILIDGKNLTIQAASTPVITGVTDAEYIIKVTNADVTLNGLTVDGTGNNIKYGIWYYDAGSGTTTGTITSCTVENIERADGSQANIRIDNSPVDITNSTIREFYKNGIFVKSAGSTGTISGNEIICRIIDNVNEVQYGVQVGWGANVTIQNNTIYDSTIAAALYDWNWASAGIYVVDAGATTGSRANIISNHIHHCMEGIHIGYQTVSGDTSYGLIQDNNIHDCFWCVGVVGDASADIENNTIKMLDADVIAFVSPCGEGIFVGGGWTTVHEYPTATITGNTIDNFDMGIDLFENADITVTENDITNCDYGIKTNTADPTYNPGETWAQTVVAHSNKIVGNSVYGIDNSANSATFDATNNWWGDASGPYHATLNSGGSGDEVSDNVVFMPWYIDAAMTTLHLFTSINVPSQIPNIYYAQNAVSDGGTINIDGDYSEKKVTINKNLTIKNDGSRDIRTITPAESSTDGLIKIPYGKTVDFTDLTFNLAGQEEVVSFLVYQGGNGTVSGCTFTGHNTSTINENGIEACNGSILSVKGCTFSNFAGDTDVKSSGIYVHTTTGGNATQVSITDNNDIQNNYIGIHVGTDAATDDYSNVSIDGNNISYNSYGVWVENANSVVVGLNNTFKCNSVCGVLVPDQASPPYVFSYNFWDASCKGRGSSYDGDIIIIPQFLDENLDELELAVFVAPATDLLKASETVTYNINICSAVYMGGFEITINYSTTDFTGASVAEGTFLSNNGATTWQSSGGSGSFTVNCSLDGTSNSASGNGTLFTITMTSNDVVNLTGSDITLPSVDLRDPVNNTITCSSTAGGTVLIDNVDPAMSGPTEAQGAYYNRAPTFATFGFTDNYGLDRIDYNFDGGSWTEIVSGLAGNSWDGTEGNTPAVYTLPVFSGLTEGSHTVNWRATDDAGNTASWSWQFYKDTEAPAGTLGIAISVVSISGMTITGQALVDATQQHEYYQFDCTNNDTYDQARAEDNNQHILTGMTQNTKYLFKYQVSDGVTNNVANDGNNWADTCNKTSWSGVYSRYTLSNPPTTSTVTCDRTTSTWYNTATFFTFTAVGGFGEGKNIEYYRYVWDRNATHSWTGVEDVWDENATTATTIELTTTEDADDWYLHVKGYNGDNIPNGSLDLGPYYFDGTAPYAVANLTALTTDESNNSVSLTWEDDSQDPTFKQYEIYGANFGDYPLYSAGTAKTLPANHAAAVSSGDWTVVTTTTNKYYTHEPTTRDFYYYVVFVEDNGGNYSTVSTMESCLSYWLGDVNTAPDGLVNTDDIALLSASWGAADVTLDPHKYRNVGPTTDNARDSRPMPDAAIDFEDLMIFSMNYGNTSYPGKDGAPENLGPIYLTMYKVLDDGQLVVTLEMEGNEGIVHGLNIPLMLGMDITLTDVEKGDIWGDDDFFIYTYEENIVEISGATLGYGTTIPGDGEIAILYFDVSGEGIETHFGEASARDGENNPIDIIYNPIVGTEDMLSSGGCTLLQNHPNPFSAFTRIFYSLEYREMITLTVYNINGKKVKTLDEGNKDAGVHKVLWNGCNNAGIRQPNGIYFYKLRAGNAVIIKKAIILR